jgi:hypothetical protein
MVAGKPAYTNYQNNPPILYSDKYKYNNVDAKSLKNVD